MTLILVFILCIVNCKAKGVFSKQNIEQASTDELNQYLKLAKGHKRTGYIMLVGGPVACVIGAQLINEIYVQGVRYLVRDLNHLPKL